MYVYTATFSLNVAVYTYELVYIVVARLVAATVGPSHMRIFDK